MKRSEGEGKGRGMKKPKVKRSKIDEESLKPSTSSLDVNPFLVEPILRKLLKKVDTVTQLKDLRKMCVLWDKVNTEELEERAFKGKIKAIDFKWIDRCTTKKKAQKELVEFLEDTRSIPRLFRSFIFFVPQSLKVLQDHSAFFSDYTISRVELYTPWTNILDKELQAAVKYFLNLIGSDLKEIQIPGICYSTSSFEPKSPNWPDQKLVLPKLEKLVIEKSEWCEFLKAALILGTGSNRITSLKLSSLPGGDIGSFPSLDPARMTRLDIWLGKEYDLAIKFSSGLMTLAERGMRLVDLGLRGYSLNSNTPASLAENLPLFCSNMTHFFATQSSTLATLHLDLNISVNWPQTKKEIKAQFAKYGKIQLPIFQALHTLYLSHDLRIQDQYDGDYKSLGYSLFDFTLSPPLRFPSLVNVTFASESSMNILCDHPELIELPQASRYHFKRLKLPRNCNYPSKSNLGHWSSQYAALIGSVEDLEAEATLLQRVSIPWGASLRELCIRDVTGPLKLAHLEKLETLVIKGLQRFVPLFGKKWNPGYFSGSGSDNTDSDEGFYNPRKNVRDYLHWFSEAKQLNLTYIKFTDLRMENGIKEELVKYFPFPVQFGKE